MIWWAKILYKKLLRYIRRKSLICLVMLHKNAETWCNKRPQVSELKYNPKSYFILSQSL